MLQDRGEAFDAVGGHNSHVWQVERNEDTGILATARRLLNKDASPWNGTAGEQSWAGTLRRPRGGQRGDPRKLGGIGAGRAAGARQGHGLTTQPAWAAGK